MSGSQGGGRQRPRGTGTQAERRLQAEQRRKKRIRNLWIRRVATMAGLLAILALAVFGIWKLAQFVIGAFSDQQATDPRSVVAPVEIAECKLNDLDFTMDGPAAVAHNSPADFGVTVTNRGAVDCSWNSGAMGLRVASGEDVVFAMKVAPDEPQSGTTAAGKPLLFPRGESWKTTINWNGQRNLEGATSQSGAVGGHAVEGGPANPGQYVAQLTVDDRPVSGVVVFSVDEPPPPAEENPAPATDAPAEEAPAPAEEAPAEQAPAEEAPVEEAPAEG